MTVISRPLLVATVIGVSSAVGLAVIYMFQHGHWFIALVALAAMAIGFCWPRLALQTRVRRDGSWTDVPAAGLVRGDIVQLSLGTVVPADAQIIAGTLLLDQSMLTGESLPTESGRCKVAYAGGIARRGEATAEVTATGKHTYFGRAAELVRTARVESSEQRAVLGVVRNLTIVNLAIIIGIVAYAHGIAMGTCSLHPTYPNRSVVGGAGSFAGHVHLGRHLGGKDTRAQRRAADPSLCIAKTAAASRIILSLAALASSHDGRDPIGHCYPDVGQDNGSQGVRRQNHATAAREAHRRSLQPMRRKPYRASSLFCSYRSLEPLKTMLRRGEFRYGWANQHLPRSPSVRDRTNQQPLSGVLRKGVFRRCSGPRIWDRGRSWGASRSVVLDGADDEEGEAEDRSPRQSRGGSQVDTLTQLMAVPRSASSARITWTELASVPFACRSRTAATNAAICKSKKFVARQLRSVRPAG